MAAPLTKLLLAGALALVGLVLWKQKEQEVARHDPRRSNGTNDVLLLSAEWCGYCQAEKQALRVAGVPFRELDIENDSEGELAYQALDGSAVPITVIGEEVVEGYDTDRLNELLEARGYSVNLQ